MSKVLDPTALATAKSPAPRRAALTETRRSGTEVAAAMKAGRPCADPHALSRYQRRRRGENLVMQNAMRGFQQLFEQRAMPLRWLRNTGMRWVNQAGPVKRFFIGQALGRGADLPRQAQPPRQRMR